MARIPLPDIGVLRHLFRYEPETGALLCAVRKDEMVGRRRNRERAAVWNRDVYNQPVGYIRNGQYLVVKIAGESFYAHRLIWKLAHGTEPEADVDHINGDRRDNRLVNLRIVEPAINSRNKQTSVRSVTGARGVYPQSNGRFIASVRQLGRTIYLGTFDTVGEAEAARLRHDAQNGFTARHSSG